MERDEEEAEAGAGWLSFSRDEEVMAEVFGSHVSLALSYATAIDQHHLTTTGGSTSSRLLLPPSSSWSTSAAAPSGKAGTSSSGRVGGGGGGAAGASSGAGSSSFSSSSLLQTAQPLETRLLLHTNLQDIKRQVGRQLLTYLHPPTSTSQSLGGLVCLTCGVPCRWRGGSCKRSSTTPVAAAAASPGPVAPCSPRISSRAAPWTTGRRHHGQPRPRCVAKPTRQAGR